MSNLAEIKTKLPEALILEFLNSNDDCTIDLMMLIELGVYKRKENAVRQLTNHFNPGIDYSEFCADQRKSTERGRPSNSYLLTSDCFKHLCMMAKTPVGKLVREYYIVIEKQWRKELLKKLVEMQNLPKLKPESAITVEVFPVQGDKDKQVKAVVADWLELVFKKTRKVVNEVYRESDRCFALIAKKASDEQLGLINAVKKGIDEVELEIRARRAITRITHRVPHQPDKIDAIVRSQVQPHEDELTQILINKLKEIHQVQPVAQLPPAKPGSIAPRFTPEGFKQCMKEVYYAWFIDNSHDKVGQNWEDYFAEKWERKKSQAYRYKDASEVFINLQEANFDLLPVMERTVRNMASLSPELQVEVWKRAIKKDEGLPTTATVNKLVKELS